MSFSLVEIFTGVYAGNDRGLEFAAGPSRTSWRGPPVVGVFEVGSVSGLSSDDRVAALQTLAARFDAPLLIVTDVSPAAAAFLRNLHLSNRLLAFGEDPSVADGSVATPVALAGPFVTFRDSLTGASSASDAWLLTSDYSRTTFGHPYKIGMMAVSSFSLFNEAPPVYSLSTTFARKT